MLYFRFLFCLAAGLFGLALLMSTVMEAVLVDYDVESELKAFFDRLTRRDRKRYVLIGDGANQIRVGETDNSAEKARVKQFLAPVGPEALIIPVPPPAGPRLKRLDIFAPKG